jgi:ribonuclease BN (tRNA processing enzyme)
VRSLPHILGIVTAISVGAAVPAQAATPQCRPFQWITLGTAGGPVPTAERSEPANLLIAGNQYILVEVGDGAVGQLARAGLSLRDVRTVFVSHHHLDHTGGLAAVIGLRWMNQYSGILTVYGPSGTSEVVDGILQSMGPQAKVGFGLGRPPPLPSDSVRTIEVESGRMLALPGGVTVRATVNSHFDRQGPADPQSLSYRFEFDGRAITFTGDTGPSDAVATLAQASDLLVSEVIDLERLVPQIIQSRKDATPEMLADLKRHLSAHHLTPEQVGQLAARASVQSLLLTHFAAPPGPLQIEALTQGVRTGYAGPLKIAQDLGRAEIPCLGSGQ